VRDDYPFQEAASKSAHDIDYNTRNTIRAMKMFEEIEERFPLNR
jgi:hypothetical protein